MVGCETVHVQKKKKTCLTLLLCSVLDLEFFCFHFQFTVHKFILCIAFRLKLLLLRTA